MSAVEFDPGSLQQELDVSPDRVWDVAIAGAGPAGSIAAGRLASQGHSVLLLDKACFPRDKTCGDALIPDSIRVLGRAGILPEVRALGFPVSAASVFSPSQIEVPIAGEYLTIKRRILDSVLARHAVREGAVFAREMVKGVAVDGKGTVRIETARDGISHRARFAILATGANVELLNQLAMVKRPHPSALALRCYMKAPLEIDRLIISYDRSITPGYGWIFPLGGGEFNVGCGVFYRKTRHKQANLREMFDRFLANFPIGQELVKRATSQTDLKGAPLRCNLTGARVLSHNSIVAVGESIGATFPLTGEGIGKAMETAELAAAAIHSALATGSTRKLTELPWRVRTDLLPRYIGYEIGERWLSYPKLNDLIAWRARRSPFLQKLLRGIISEAVDPRRLFSIGGLLKSLWR